MRSCNRKLKKCSMNALCNLNLSFMFIYTKPKLRLSQIVLSWGKKAYSLVYNWHRLVYLAELYNFFLKKSAFCYKRPYFRIELTYTFHCSYQKQASLGKILLFFNLLLPHKNAKNLFLLISTLGLKPHKQTMLKIRQISKKFPCKQLTS